MDETLTGRKVAILVMDNFEQVELTGPREALEAAGARCVIASAKRGQVTGMKHDEKADLFDVDLTFEQLRAQDYDGVLLPGGVFNADAMRMQAGARKFVQEIAAQGKPIAVICHGAWLLASAGLVRGKTLTSWPTLQDDLRNAGATWVDQVVVKDGNLVSSRKPDDIPEFSRTFIDVLTANQPAVPA